MQMPGRVWNGSGYRFGYQGQEKDDEVHGIGNTNTAEFWEYETRLGRRWNTDPVIKPWSSGYGAFAENPIFYNDPNGDEEKPGGELRKDKSKWKKFDTKHDQVKLDEITVEVSKSNGKAVDHRTYPERYRDNMLADIQRYNKMAEEYYSKSYGKYDEGHYPDWVYQHANQWRLQDRLKYYQSNEITADYGGAISAHGIPIETADPTLDAIMLATSFGTSAIIEAEVETIATDAVADGAHYSVAFEMKLPNNLYPGVGRTGHFKAANEVLDATMVSDMNFARMMEDLGVSIPRSPTGTILGKSPTNWAWHHELEPGIMQLVPKSQHPNIPGGKFWEVMHPNRRGGFSLWGK